MSYIEEDSQQKAKSPVLNKSQTVIDVDIKDYQTPKVSKPVAIVNQGQDDNLSQGTYLDNSKPQEP